MTNPLTREGRTPMNDGPYKINDLIADRWRITSQSEADLLNTVRAAALAELTAADKAALAAQDFLDTIETEGVVMMKSIGGIVTWTTTLAHDEARAELVDALKEFHAEPAADPEGENDE